jgi:hypothetical protein
MVTTSRNPSDNVTETQRQDTLRALTGHPVLLRFVWAEIT